LVQSPLLSAEVAGAFDQIVRAVLHPCSPFSRLFTGAEKGMQIFHIKSQSNYLTSWVISFFSLILHSDWQCDQRSDANLGRFKQSSVGVMIATVTLSQIVHLTLRRMFDLKANFEKQRRLIA
jgi:hypothetical protein